jgi:CBS domain-containing protein
VTVADLMSRSLVTVERGAGVRDAARRMCERHVGSILVMEADRLVGILTERDILALFADDRGDVTVETAMTRNPETLEADASTDHARLVMLHGGFRHLPIVEDDQVVGIVSMRDLLARDDDAAPRGV